MSHIRAFEKFYHYVSSSFYCLAKLGHSCTACLSSREGKYCLPRLALSIRQLQVQFKGQFKPSSKKVVLSAL